MCSFQMMIENLILKMIPGTTTVTEFCYFLGFVFYFSLGFFYYYFFFVVLEFELRASHLLSLYSNT
jgi:hypothetical protein